MTFRINFCYNKFHQDRIHFRNPFIRTANDIRRAYRAGRSHLRSIIPYAAVYVRIPGVYERGKGDVRMEQDNRQKALFFDIDGTILSEINHTIPKSAIAAIGEAVRQGHLVFINTGRTFCTIPAEVLEIKFDGFLCGCGTDIVYNGKHLFCRDVPEEEGRPFLELIARCNMDAVLEGRDRIYFQDHKSRFPAVTEIYGASADKIDVHVGWDDVYPVFSKLIAFGDQDSRDEEFCRESARWFDVVCRGGQFYELVPKGHSKAKVIDYVLEHFGIRRENAWVFGDSGNDLSMFEAVPNAVAMGKHDRVLEPYASYIAATVEEDGLYRAMVKLGLIPELVC